MKQPSSSISRLVCLAVVAVLTVESVVFTSSYIAAYEYVQQHDPRRSESASDTLVFCRPRELAVGQRIGIIEVVRHLQAIGYEERAGADGGTFHVSSERLQINSRLPEFPSPVIIFRRQRIVAISLADRLVNQVQMEPLPLISFVRLVKGDVAPRMRVRRVILTESDLIPSKLYDAVRSSEDFRFETHNGVDELGMIRGFITGSGGGSTLTQQLMKNVVLRDQTRTYPRYFKGMVLALAAERQMTKSEIFTAYSNNIYMGEIPEGPVLWGFGAAAKEFYDKQVSQLTTAEAAALAGCLDKPEKYIKAARAGDYTFLLKRRRRGLDLMRRNFPEKYSEEEISRAKSEPLKFLFASEREQERPFDMISRQFQDYAAAQAKKLAGVTDKNGHLRIYTTIDPELQVAAHDAVTKQLVKLDPAVTAARRRQAVNQPDDEPIQAALVAMDPRTGEVLAMVGNRDGLYNFATGLRSPGSIVKPFVYLKALETGRHGDSPFNAATWIDPKHDPVDNYRPSQHVGQPDRARNLLARSDNGAAVVAAHDAGLRGVRNFIDTLTMSHAQELTGMLAIGGAAGSELSLINAVEGYTVFPNNGLKARQTPFTSVYKDGVKLELPHEAPARVTDAGAAYVLSQMLRSVLQPGGTAAGLRMEGLSNYYLALKTGTGQVADLWVVGFSPRLVVGVWVGMPKNKPALPLNQGFDGARTAGPIWTDFMRAVARHRPDLLSGEIPRPANVKTLNIRRDRGCVTSDSGVEEYFIQGREPAACK